MNKKQLIITLGLGAYVAGGSIVVVFNLGTFMKILQSQRNIFIPVLATYIPVLSIGILMIYFLRERKK